MSLHKVNTLEFPEIVQFETRPKTIEEKIAKYDWNSEVAYAVMMAESNANPKAKNLNDQHNGCVGSYGLFQIACLHVDDPSTLLEEDYNIKKAYEIYSEQGWSPWGAWSNGSYLAYLN